MHVCGCLNCLGVYDVCVLVTFGYLLNLGCCIIMVSVLVLFVFGCFVVYCLVAVALLWFVFACLLRVDCVVFALGAFLVVFCFL